VKRKRKEKQPQTSREMTLDTERSCRREDRVDRAHSDEEYEYAAWEVT
jgi:hypothetical protein